MSFEVTKRFCTYLRDAAESTPEARTYLIHATREGNLQCFPNDVIYEPLRGPMQNLTRVADVFSVPDENLFFIDLLRSVVSTATQLRQTYFVELNRSPVDGAVPVVWIVTDAYTHACRALLHAVRHANSRSYRLQHLFLARDALLESNPAQLLHEVLLFAFLILADYKGYEVRLMFARIHAVGQMTASMRENDRRPSPICPSFASSCPSSASCATRTAISCTCPSPKSSKPPNVWTRCAVRSTG